MTYFKHDIYDWASWGKVYQDIAAWQRIIKDIFQKENLPFTQIEQLTAGTNAVFKVGRYVIKIFAPKESGVDSTREIETESFAIQHAKNLGISVPSCVSFNVLQDKYRFDYMIMEFIEGKEFAKLAPNLSDNEKFDFAKKLRNITDKMNIACPSFNDIDAIHDIERSKRWNRYPKDFQIERINYLNTYNFKENVFVHGDLCSDNILVSKENEVIIIDFADALVAPILYEHALVASELFRFDQAYLQGYFGEYDDIALTDICFHGLLIHDFGADIIEQQIALPSEIISLAILKERMYTAITLGLKYKNSQ